MPEYDADNIIRQVLADATQHHTGIAHGPTHVNNPQSDASFYQFAMTCGPFFMCMHDQSRVNFERRYKQEFKNAKVGSKINISPFASMVLASRYEDIDIDNKNRPAVSVPYGVNLPPSSRELMLIDAMAQAMSPTYPDLAAQIQSTDSTLFALPYTSGILHNNFVAESHMTKINCLQPVSTDFNAEASTRTSHLSRCNACGIRNWDSHCFALFFA